MQFLQHKFLIIDYGTSNVKGALCESGPLGKNILALETLPIVKNTMDYDRMRQEASDNSLKAGEEEELEELTPEELEMRKQQMIEQKFWDEYEYNLVRFVQTFFPDEANYIIALPANHLHIRNFTLPLSKPREAMSLIAFEAESSLPYSLDSLDVVGHIWGNSTEEMNVLAFGAKHSLITKAVHPLRSNQSMILTLSVNAAMLAGLIRILNPEIYEGRSIAQLDVGANTTLLNIIDDGKLAFSRTLPYGGDDITKIIAEVLRVDEVAAEKRKLNLELNILDTRQRSFEFYQKHKIKNSDYLQILNQTRTWAENICLEVERSFLALRCPMPECFYLSGGASLLGGFKIFTRESLQKNIERYPFQLGNGETPEKWGVILGAREQYHLPIEQKDDFITTDFGSSLRGGQFSWNALRTPFSFAIGALVIFIASIFLGVIVDRSYIANYSDEIEALSKTIPGVTADQSPEEILIQVESLCEKRVRSVKRSSLKVLSLLEAITNQSPAKEDMELIFKRLTFDGKAIELMVEVANVSASTELQGKLNASRSFQNVEAKRRKILANQRAEVTYLIKPVTNKQISSASCL